MPVARDRIVHHPGVPAVHRHAPAAARTLVAALVVAALFVLPAAAGAARPAAKRDVQAPSVPQGQRIAAVTARTVLMRWLPARDDVGVAGYEVWLDGVRVGRTTVRSFTYAKLACGRTYIVGLVAVDRAGNRSDRRYAMGPARTAACRSRVARPTPVKAPARVPTPAPPPVGPVVELSGTVSAADLFAAAARRGAGPVTVRPAAGAGSFTVDGRLTIRRAGLQVVGARVVGSVDFAPGADGSSFLNGSATSFNIHGADDVTISDSTFDGEGRVAQSFILDQPAGSTPDRFRILRNTFRNFHGVTSDIHSEALFIGFSTAGLIEGNTFENNGNTSHIFFTWWGARADASSSYPRDMCVRGNRFGTTHGAYYAVNLREEIPSSTGIDVEPAPSNTITSSIALSASPAIVRSC